jgi:hypothetical protein
MRGFSRFSCRQISISLCLCRGSSVELHDQMYRAGIGYNGFTVQAISPYIRWLPIFIYKDLVQLKLLLFESRDKSGAL